MSAWNLSDILAELHSETHQGLVAARKVISHAPTKGDVSESVWLGLLQKYLPKRYQATKAFVVDSAGNFSEQIDVVIYDRQYTPFIWNFGGEVFLPAESVYAIFEAKQEINAANLAYAKNKVASVRKLHRTTLPIPHAGGVHEAKPPQWIIGGFLALANGWNSPFGAPFLDALQTKSDNDLIDIGCVSEIGFFSRTGQSEYSHILSNKAATAFLFELIALLQEKATVPMIDIRAYSKWL